MKRAFFYDQSRCMACNSCTVACKDWNQINPGPVRWRTQITHESGTSNAPIFANLSMACNHCEEPACKSACSAGAITQNEDGIVAVDRTKCIGLQSCISACPFAVPKIAGNRQEPVKKETWQIEHPMQKCDFCSTRTALGESPVCVASCGAHALEYGDYDLLMAKYPDAVQINQTDFPFAYVNKTPNGAYTDTKPRFLIRKRKPLNII